MLLKRLLRPTNRGIRYLVGALLVGLLCIQCLPAGRDGQASALRGGHEHVAFVQGCVRSGVGLPRDFEVALGLDRKVRYAVLAEMVQHVVEKTDAGVGLDVSSPGDIERQLDRGLGGAALDRGCSVGHGMLALRRP